MFKYLIVIFFAVGYLQFSLSQTKIDSAEINTLRQYFYQSIEDEDKLNDLEKFISKNYSDDYTKYAPIILAYYGGTEALKAKHAFNPVSKLSYLISALNRLEEAVKMDSMNLEIRFMRFSILHHLPGILGYGSERENDKDIICHLLRKKDYTMLNYDIQKGIVEFMLESERLTKKQTEELKKLAVSLAKNE